MLMFGAERIFKSTGKVTEVDIDDILSHSVNRSTKAKTTSGKDATEMKRTSSLVENTMYTTKEFNFAIKSLGIREFEVR